MRPVLKQVEQWPLRCAAGIWDGWATEVDTAPMPIEVANHYRRQGYQPKPELMDQIQADGGVREPIILNTDGKRGYLHDGHHRLDSAAELGMTHVPVKVNRIDDELSHYPELEDHVRGILNGKSQKTAGTEPAAADFMMWCITNHRPMDSQSLGKFAQANDLSAQEYRDLLAFLQGQRWPD